VSDGEYPDGQVGFYVETFDETLAHLHYDSLTVTEPEPLVEPVAKILYEEKFVDESGGWPTEDVEGSAYRIGYHPPDYYHVEVRAPEEHLVVPHGEDYGDVRVETSVLVDHTDTGSGDFRYGLAVRQRGEDEYYAFVVDPRVGSWQALKRTPAGLEELASGEVQSLHGIAPAGVTPDKTDKLQVDAKGSEFVFSINDEVVGQVSDGEYPDGQVGFYVETFDETLAHLHYDSLIVREVKASTFEALATPVAPTPTPPEGMALIPAGYFKMGSSSGQANERPEHPVFLDAFYLDLYEVTNAQYRECVKALGCTQTGPNSVTRQGYRDDPAYDNYPLISVTWDQADAYCKWAGQHLPTEAQWEYAASGPENFTWPWGDTFKAALMPAAETDTQPVGSYSDGVSPFGIFDMAGNVAEWVADDYDEAFYANSPSSNPFSTNVSAGRIFRGGSFGKQSGSSYTTSRRDGNIRTYSDVRVGFRCAQDASEVTLPDERATLVAEFCEVYANYKPGALCP
jgi:formylglycine-generating enzyme required for sulfatase activity